MLLEPQISILEWFLKDHVTLKTGVIQLWYHINTLHIQIYSNRKVILNCNNMFTLLQLFWSIKCSLGEHTRLLSKPRKSNLPDIKLLNDSVALNYYMKIQWNVLTQRFLLLTYCRWDALRTLFIYWFTHWHITGHNGFLKRLWNDLLIAKLRHFCTWRVFA